MERQIFNKRTPTEGERTFIPLPSDVRHYIHDTRMSAEKLFLYSLIIDYFNPGHGYAFPSVEKLAVSYGKAPDTTSRHLDDLKAVGLIDFPEKGYYVPLVPLDEDAFYREYPAAFANYQKAIKRCETRRKQAGNRMREWRAQHGYGVE